MPDRPNVLFVLTDQHRLEAVSCYADTPCSTPTVDRLAREGVRFENAYTPYPVCTPARASLLTGQFPHATGFTSNVGNTGCSFHSVADAPELLSRRLQSAGYDLGYTGKWHLCLDEAEAFGRPVDNHLPSDVGFEGQDFPGHGGGGWDSPQYRAYLEERGYDLEVTELGGEYALGQRAAVVEAPTEATVPYFLTEHTISLLESFREREDPFFLWHNFWGPHEPYWPSREFYDRYEGVEIPPWPNFEWPAADFEGSHHEKLHPDAETMTWADWEPTVRHYYAFAEMIDAQIGRLLDYMAETGLLAETVVVFAADHGETIGSHGGLFDKGFHHFEEITHVPLVVRFPDGRWADTTREEGVSLLDLYPTFCELAGVEPRPDAHGESLLSLLRGEADWRDAVVVEFEGLGNVASTQRTVRVGELKYGYNHDGRDELYDLSIDPHETRNLVDHPDYREAVVELRDALESRMQETDDPVYPLEWQG
jgi:arylsulfatase A-like enzyme